MTGDQRREDRRQHLVEAAIDVLSQHGWQGATVAAVCERAGLIARYFYESFKDRDDLLVVVFDDIIREVAAQVAPGLDPHEPVGVGIAASIGTWLEVTTRDPRKGRVAFIEALGSAALMERRMDATRTLAHALLRQAANSHDVTEDNRSAFVVASHVVAGGLVETMVEWIHGRIDTTAEVVVEHFTRSGEAAFDAAAASGVTH